MNIETLQSSQEGGLETKQWKTRRKGGSSIFDPAIIRRALLDAFKKLDPRWQVKNPVMFVVEIGSVISTVEFVRLLFGQGGETWFVLAVTIWLWFTVLFANFAEAMAEGRGKAQADSLRRTRSTTMAKRLATPRRDGEVEEVAASLLRKGDIVLVEAGDVIPGDGDVIEGVASVDESAITGEWHRSFARAAATAQPSREARGCSPTGLSCKSRLIRARPFWIA